MQGFLLYKKDLDFTPSLSCGIIRGLFIAPDTRWLFFLFRRLPQHHLEHEPQNYEDNYRLSRLRRKSHEKENDRRTDCPRQNWSKEPKNPAHRLLEKCSDDCNDRPTNPGQKRTKSAKYCHSEISHFSLPFLPQKPAARCEEFRMSQRAKLKILV